MKEAVAMHERQGLKYLVHDVPDLRLREASVSLLHEFVEIPIHKFENEVQLIVLTYDLTSHEQRLHRLYRGIFTSVNLTMLG